MGLVGEAWMLLSMLSVLGGMWCVLLWVLAVGRVLRWVLPVLGGCSVLRVLLVLTVLAVLGVLTVLVVLVVLGMLAVLVVGATVLWEVLCVG